MFLYPLLRLAACAALLLGCSIPLSAQNKITKDLDGDSRLDTILLDRKEHTLSCMLSGLQYKPIKSGRIAVLHRESTIYFYQANDFVFRNDWDGVGYQATFNYNKETRKLELVGLGRYDAGNPSGDGSGQSQLNLQTGDYKGTWNYYNEKTGRLVELPELKAKMNLPPCSLEQFTDQVTDDYIRRCNALYERQRKTAEGK